MSQTMGMEPLWTVRELAQYLQYQESTVRRLACSEPERLPPRVQSLGRPRWDPETVRRWVLAPAETRKRRVGRPRSN